MKDDYESDQSLDDYLESSKAVLHSYWSKNYKVMQPVSDPAVPSPTAPIGSLPKFSFTARYHKTRTTTADELEEYFKLPPEDFELCDPIKWWVGRRAQFPSLSRLALDILSIPGE
jgi:hypothetical protein